MATGWAWEYIEHTLTPPRLTALRAAAEPVASSGGDSSSPAASPAPTGGPPPMNTNEFMRWVDRTGGQIPGIGKLGAAGG